MYMIETKNIIEQYETHLASNNVNISVKEWSIFGLFTQQRLTVRRIISRITVPDSEIPVSVIKSNNKSIII
jgi:hypothetical protein